MIGRWFWNTLDNGLSRLSGVGALYRTLKQILGFDAGEGGLFQDVVLVRDESTDSVEIGLVTFSGSHGETNQLVVFVPFAPNPSQGRLLHSSANRVTRADWSVDKALKPLFSLGRI